MSEVTVESQYYVDMFNDECGVEHPVNVDGLTFKMIWDSEAVSYTHLTLPTT